MRPGVCVHSALWRVTAWLLGFWHNC